MTTVSLSVRRTPVPGDVGAWLLPGPRRATRRGVDDALATSHGSPGAETLRHLGSAAAAALREQVLTALRSVLGTTVADLLLEGWRKHGTLIKAAEASVAEPGARRFVTLAEHRVQSVHQPTVDIAIDDVLVLTLRARWEIDFEIGTVVAVVCAGRLVAVRAGNAKVTGTVALQDTEIARRTTHVPLRVVLNLGRGIALTPATR